MSACARRQRLLWRDLPLHACLGGAPVEEDPALRQQLLSIQDGSSEQQRLHDLVPGDWTTVHIFDMESSTREYVEEKVGHSLDMSSFYYAEGDVFIFVNDEEVVRGSVVYDVRFRRVYQSGDTESVVMRDATASGLLELKQP